MGTAAGRTTRGARANAPPRTAAALPRLVALDHVVGADDGVDLIHRQPERVHLPTGVTCEPALHPCSPPSRCACPTAQDDTIRPAPGRSPRPHVDNGTWRPEKTTRTHSETQRRSKDGYGWTSSASVSMTRSLSPLASSGRASISSRRLRRCLRCRLVVAVASGSTTVSSMAASRR